MTLRELERLPVLLSRSQVLACGIPRRAINDLVKRGEIRSIRFKETGKSKYLKSSVAKFIGL